MTPRPVRLRKWVVVGYAAAGVLLVPWIFWLSSNLKAHHTTHHWDVAWTGFDIGLVLAFLGTALSAWRRSPWLQAFAAATGTLLLVDAWFDIVLEDRNDDLRWAIVTAVVAELPAAAVCFFVAYRTERFLQQAVEVASHLAATRERTTEGDLVRVLEVSPDGEAAREARHPDAAA
jgi:hypothetical protein